MTEQELIALQFDKIMVYDEESNNGYDYYYFRKKLGGGISLIGDVTLNGTLYISLEESETLDIKDIKVVRELINVFDKIKND